jgi:hypothetical protein
MTDTATRIETETDVFSHAGHHAFETFIAILHAQDRLETFHIRGSSHGSQAA